MKWVKTPAEVHAVVAELRCEGKRVGLVPTMGALHEGHLSLVRLARSRADLVVVSVFVNPKQFGPGEDYTRYPREIDRDSEVLASNGCDVLFAPSVECMYSVSDRTRIHVTDLSEPLCGESRPGHFDGVALVVAKLFNIVRPDVAVFGQKDAQQAVIIQRMTADLDYPIRIVIGPTVREPDGLAMSSRNSFLSGDERKRAMALFGALGEARRMITSGERDAVKIRAAMHRVMTEAGIDVEYADVVEGATMKPKDRIEGTLLLAVAGRLGGTRLIDNMALRIDGDEIGEVVLEFPEWSMYDS
ncbi:MAG: pantoate--beta-alanine ligase [bacterium]|nr:MAG: pantoate--beta-alanine ligase [bacterium]